jgi:hypothetical protein
MRLSRTANADSVASRVPVSYQMVIAGDTLVIAGDTLWKETMEDRQKN